MGFQYLFVYKMQKSKSKTDLYWYYKHINLIWKYVSLIWKHISLILKNTTIWSQLWYVRISIWYEKYQIKMFENINFICSKIWKWYGNIRDQNWYAKIPDSWPVLVFYFLCVGAFIEFLNNIPSDWGWSPRQLRLHLLAWTVDHAYKWWTYQEKSRSVGYPVLASSQWTQ